MIKGTFILFLGTASAKSCYVCKATMLANPTGNQADPEPYPSDADSHPCFKPMSNDQNDYNGEYGLPSVQTCDDCVAIAYSMKYSNSYEYTIHRGCQENFDHGLNFTVDDCLLNWSSGKPTEKWCELQLTKKNYGNYGTINARYTTEVADPSKADITANDQAGLTWQAKKTLSCYQEEIMKEESSDLSTPSKKLRCEDIFSRSCYSAVSRFDGEDDNGDLREYAYAKRGCSNEISPEDDNVNTLIRFHHPIPGTVANGTMEVKYCNTDDCNNYVPSWTTSNAMLLGISSILVAFLNFL